MSNGDKSRLNCAVAAEPRLECRFPLCNCKPKASPLPSTAATGETPRTDALASGIAKRRQNRGFNMPEDVEDSIDLARQLERDLAEAKDDCLRLHREKMDALFGPDGFPRSATDAIDGMTLITHWELALNVWDEELAKGRARSYAMREALLRVGDKIASVDGGNKP